jgi:hypothetical protein
MIYSPAPWALQRYGLRALQKDRWTYARAWLMAVWRCLGSVSVPSLNSAPADSGSLPAAGLAVEPN